MATPTATPEMGISRRYDPELLGVVKELGEPEFDTVAALRRATEERFADIHCVSDDRVEIANVVVPTSGGSLRLRVYRPTAGARGGILWIHGGAFCVGTPEMDDDICRNIAAEHRLMVVSPDYRLAPEHPYPAAENDCRAAFAWLRRECPPGGGTARRAAIAGASAGGHLALAVAIDEVRAGRKVDRLFLAYPVVVPDLAPSHSRYLSAPVFDGRQAQLMWQRYLGRDGDAVVPLLLDDALAALPFTFVITVEHDPLRDGGLELVRRLIGAGVSVQSQHVAGAFHAYDRFAPTSELARQFRYNLAAFLERPAPRAIAGKIDS